MSKFLAVNIEQWVYGTVEKVQKGTKWNDAWLETYKDIGGTSTESGKKSCPKNSTRTLYELGRLKNTNTQYISTAYPEILENYSKNGVYAVMAIEILAKEPHLALRDLWSKIKLRFEQELEKQPARSNQGGPTIAYKLWQLGLIRTK